MAKQRTTKKRAARRDGWANPETGHGTSRDHREYTTFSPRGVTDEYMRSLWRGDDVIGRIVEDLPDEAWRRSVTFTLGSKEGDDKEEAAALAGEWEDIGADTALKECGYRERALGGGAILPIIEGSVGQLDEPLDDYMDRIGKIVALHVFEPREMQPDSWYTKLSDPKFRQPQTWRVTPLSGATGRAMVGDIIHESRMIIMPGIRVSPQPLIGTRLGWGDSVTLRVLEVCASFGLSWGSAAKILADFDHGIYQLDQLDEILAENGGEDELDRRLAAMDRRKSSLRAAVIGKNDTFTRAASSLAGYSDLLIQLAFRVSAAAKMPASRLFGMAPQGMNATGEYDQSSWYDAADAYRTEKRKPAERLARLMMLQADGPTAGKEPANWKLEFPALKVPSEKEQADTRYVVAQADKIYFEMGAASNDDIANSRWKGGRYSPEMSIDWKAREEQKKIDEAQPTPEDLAAMGIQPPQQPGQQAAQPPAPPVPPPNGANGKANRPPPAGE